MVFRALFEGLVLVALLPLWEFLTTKKNHPVFFCHVVCAHHKSFFYTVEKEVNGKTNQKKQHK